MWEEATSVMNPQHHAETVRDRHSNGHRPTQLAEGLVTGERFDAVVHANETAPDTTIRVRHQQEPLDIDASTRAIRH